MKHKILKKSLLALALLPTLYSCGTYYSKDITVSFFNDGDTTIAIDQIIVSHEGSRLIDNQTRILPGEELTIGTNIREFTIKEGSKKYHVTLPFGDTSCHVVSLRYSTIKALLLGIIVKELSSRHN